MMMPSGTVATVEGAPGAISEGTMGVARRFFRPRRPRDSEEETFLVSEEDPGAVLLLALVLALAVGPTPTERRDLEDF